jgi:phosphonate dehydrogenase
LLTHWVHQPVIDYLSQRFDVMANPGRETWDRATVIERAGGCDAMMAFMPDTVDNDFLSACPRLKVIAAALKGPDNFDIAACTRHGVWFTLVPDLLTVPTAELGIALLLGLTRRVLEGDDHIRSGRFAGWRPELYGTGLSGRVAGIIGMGAVGRALASRLSVFGLKIIYADPQPAEFPPGMDVRRCTREEVVAASDFLFPLTHLNVQTLHMIDAWAISAMRPRAYLINIGRGSLVDEAAVAEALASGRLSGYAADVFEMEDWALPSRPRTIHPRLISNRSRTLFTPHIGSAVEEVRFQIEMEAAANIVDVFEGRRPRGAINEIARLNPASA